MHAARMLSHGKGVLKVRAAFSSGELQSLQLPLTLLGHRIIMERCPLFTLHWLVTIPIFHVAVSENNKTPKPNGFADHYPY